MKNAVLFFLLFSVNAMGSEYEIPSNASYNCEDGTKLRVSSDSSNILVLNNGTEKEYGLGFGSMGDPGYNADFTIFEFNNDNSISSEAFIWFETKNGLLDYDRMTASSPYNDELFNGLETKCVRSK
jgi:hypothetical protein